MAYYPYKVDYAGRQVDVELLQSIPKPVLIQRVTVSNVSQAPKIVAGIEKMAQRFALLLLTSVDEVHFDPDVGTYLIPALAGGAIADSGQLNSVFALSVLSVQQAMAADDKNVDRFGTIPDDELLTAASLDDVSFDYAQSKVIMQITLTSAAGTSVTYIVPISVAR